MSRRELVCEDPAGVVAERIAEAAAEAIAARGRFTLAVSGGRSPAAMFARLRRLPIDWPRVVILQVDERIAPPGHADRNLTSLRSELTDHVPVGLCPMPVEAPDPAAAARAYEAALRALCGEPPVIDVVHLGLGSDGHTASLVPGDPVLDAPGEVAVTGTYQGRRRLTLTAEALNRAREVLWLVTGSDKRAALASLRAGDPRCPASAVTAPGMIVSDRSAGG